MPTIRFLLLAVLALASHGTHANDDIDYHFRAFAIEPADRMSFGKGHVTVGIERSHPRHKGAHVRTTLPMELTLGLPAGFSAILEIEGSLRFFGGQPPQAVEKAERGFGLKYALPEMGGVHIAAVADVTRVRSGNHHSYSVVAARDTPVGHVGAGYIFERRQPGEARNAHSFGIHWFRLWDSGWGFGAELRGGRTPEKAFMRHALMGVAWRVAPGIMLDAAVGQTVGADRERLLTVGSSFYF